MARICFSVALHGQTDAVRILLMRGSYQPDERDCCGTTPLMDALRAGFVDVAKVLIQQQHVRSLCHSCMKTTSYPVVISKNCCTVLCKLCKLHRYYICQVFYRICIVPLLAIIMQYI